VHLNTRADATAPRKRTDVDFVNLVPDSDRVFVLVVDVEVYFGWSLPHKAPPGGFVNEAEPK
jgi:hypothetical protein